MLSDIILLYLGRRQINWKGVETLLKKKSILEIVDSDIVDAAKRFISLIKSHSIKKITLPNEFEDYSDEDALESIKAMNRNPDVEKTVVELYEPR